MLPDRISNPGPLTYESVALPLRLKACHSMSKSSNSHEKSVKKHAYELLLIYVLVRLQTPGKRLLSSHMMKQFPHRHTTSKRGQKNVDATL